MLDNYSRQKQEIKTIRKRSLRLKLSDADCKRLAELCGGHGLTVEELIENFIGDLVNGTYSNGSDERMYARQWFKRCWFGMFPEETFLYYLITSGYICDVLELWDSIQNGKEELDEVKRNPMEYEPEEERFIREDIEYFQTQIDTYWSEYFVMNTEYKKGTFEEEMKKVLDWNERLNQLLAAD